MQTVSDKNFYYSQIINIAIKGTSNNSHSVTPAQAGVHLLQYIIDSRFHGNDIFRGILKSVLLFHMLLVAQFQILRPAWYRRARIRKSKTQL